MYIKRYTVAAVIWMALVGWYVHTYITPETMGIDFFGIPLPSLKIAVWVVVPIAVLYIGSVFHMAFYSMLGNFRLRKYEKDYEKIIDAIADAYLGRKERHYTFKTDRYKLLGSLLENTSLSPMGELDTNVNNETIRRVLIAVEKIKKGEVVDLKQFNLLPTNPLVIQNERNKYKMGALKPIEILSNASKYDRSFCEEVYSDFAKTASASDIEKYKDCLTRDAFYNIIARINSGENKLDISNDALISLMKKLNFSKQELIDISKRLARSGMIPEERMKLFEVFSEENEDAIDAYLYTLFDLEMISLAREVLQNAHSDEYQNFQAYLALKECGKNFNIELFV